MILRCAWTHSHFRIFNSVDLTDQGRREAHCGPIIMDELGFSSSNRFPEQIAIAPVRETLKLVDVLRDVAAH